MPNYTYSDDPDSAIKNKLGASTHDELDRLEGAYVAARETELMIVGQYRETLTPGI